jgi:RimJ/RimL family protein N-acetyltransferase
MSRSQWPLLTERLTLRPFEQMDLDAMHAIYGREDVNRYLDWGPRSRDDVRQWLDRISKMTALGPQSEGVRLAAVLKGTETLIGDFSVWRTSREHQQGEIGFVVHPDYQGSGYGVEAARVMLGLGFESLGFHRIAGQCDPRNLASAGLMERLGMRREAHLLENELVKGEWVGTLVYAMLAGEWLRRAPTRATPRG